MNGRIPLGPLAALALASCGYGWGGLYEIKDVRVPIFDNASERRTLEFELTDAVVCEMASRGFRVNSREATHTLSGRILEVRNPSRVEGKDDVVLVGSLAYTVEVSLVTADGKVVWADRKIESVSFAASRLESLDTARREILDRLARWIVVHFEKEW